jgi:hypothetical protein
VFLDLVDEYPVPYFRSVDQWQRARAEREKERKALQAEWLSGSAGLQRFRPGQTDVEAAARLFEELEKLRLVNPVWWARESRPYYAAVLKCTLKRLGDAPSGSDKQRLYARATTCYYHLGLYEKWEAGQTILGIHTAREVEKSIRWDGLRDFEGKGYETITTYLKQNTSKEGDAAPDVPARQETLR